MCRGKAHKATRVCLFKCVQQSEQTGVVAYTSSPFFISRSLFSSIFFPAEDARVKVLLAHSSESKHGIAHATQQRFASLTAWKFVILEVLNLKPRMCP